MMRNSETIINTTLTRREFLEVSGLGLAGATLLGTLGCGGGGSGGEGVGFTSSGSAYQRAQTKAWLKPYSNETGTKIRQDSLTDYAKIQSMVENNRVTWDVVNVSNDFGLQSTADLLEPLDYSVIDKEPILEGALRIHPICTDKQRIYPQSRSTSDSSTSDGSPRGWRYV
jgi:spermidine/putrescine-binding protein